MMGTQVTEEQLQSIAARAIQEADLDQDGVISFDEFRKVRRAAARTTKKSLKFTNRKLKFFCFQSLEKINLDHRMSVRFLR